MNVLCWIVEGTWPACVAAASTVAPADAEIALLHVSGADVSHVTRGAYAGLLGRGRHDDPGDELDQLAAMSATELLRSAAERLGRPARQLQRTGRIEREVVTAAATADLLIVVRDGDHRRPGPRSLGPATRFVVDHAPCPVLLVWPEP